MRERVPKKGEVWVCHPNGPNEDRHRYAVVSDVNELNQVHIMGIDDPSVDAPYPVNVMQDPDLWSPPEAVDVRVGDVWQYDGREKYHIIDIKPEGTKFTEGDPCAIIQEKGMKSGFDYRLEYFEQKEWVLHYRPDDKKPEPPLDKSPRDVIEI